MSSPDSIIYCFEDSHGADFGVVDSRLDEFNQQAAPLSTVESLACFAKLPSGEVVGGAIGRTCGKCCELQQLWVDEQLRGNGIGSRLLKLFEERASMRGCCTYYLETFSFQSPEFYRSLGYNVALEIKGFPDGIIKYVMVKETQ
jgi:GNAT superfamily N-acetyltransferase